MNIYDISRKAGVSIATVSRVMNGSANVSEQTRQRILDIMKEEDYTPNAFARGLGLNTMKIVGLLCADSSDQFFARAIYFLEHALRANNYDAILSCTSTELDTKKKYLKLLLAKKVDAVILVGSTFIEPNERGNQYILDAAQEVPVIILNGYLKADNVYCSLCDDADSIHQTASAYLKRGRTDLLFLYRSDSYSGRRKLRGFMDACAEQGISPDPRRILLFNGTIPETRDKLLELAASGLTFDTVIAGDDELAIGALKYAKQAGLSVPSEFNIVGYNNSQLGICSEPELTTIDNQLEFCCNNAVAALMSALDGRPTPGRTVLSADLVVRGTTDIF